MMKTTTIADVTARELRNGVSWWIITDAEGVKHTTRNMWAASLCRRANELDRPVTLWSSSGWYYRDLVSVDFADARPSTEAADSGR